MKQWIFFVSLLIPVLLLSACTTSSQVGSSQKGEEPNVPAQVSSENPVSDVGQTSEDGPNRNELLEQAFKKEELGKEVSPLVSTVVDIESVYSEFAKESSVHEISIPLPEGWTILAAEEPIQSDKIFDHYIPEDSQAAFYIYDEQGNRCGMLGLDQYPDIEVGEFTYSGGNNLHFADENPNVTACREDGFEPYIAVVEHWTNEEGILYNDGILMKNPDTAMIVALEIDLNRLSDEQLKTIAEQMQLG